MRVMLISGVVVLAGLAWANWPVPDLPERTKVDRILVRKEARTLTLFEQGRSVATYPISLGRVPTGAKRQEGDKKTPEGRYLITEHKSDSAFYRALRISYPNTYDQERARLEKRPPGSNIMVHGLPNGLGLIGRVHRWMDWTAGCVAVTNSEMKQIFAVVQPQAEIEILP